METSFIYGLFLVVVASLVGGYTAKRFKVGIIVGYIVAGIAAGAIFPVKNFGIERLAEIGSILLLFSIGLELSIDKYKGIFTKIVLAAIIQMILVTLILILPLRALGLDFVPAIILSVGFSLSSTAVVVKMLFDKGEGETLHGRLMIGWLLVQDLMAVPIMVLIPIFSGDAEKFLVLGTIAVGKSFILVAVALILGKKIVPFFIHKIAESNSRELLLLMSVSLAVGTAVAMTYFGISPALGAFIAGFVISESQENHAVFAETRPLKNLFVALFFVTLGFFVTPEVVFSNLVTILMLSVIVMLLKFIIILFIRKSMMRGKI